MKWNSKKTVRFFGPVKRSVNMEKRPWNHFRDFPILLFAYILKMGVQSVNLFSL